MRPMTRVRWSFPHGLASAARLDGWRVQALFETMLVGLGGVRLLTLEDAGDCYFDDAAASARLLSELWQSAPVERPLRDGEVLTRARLRQQRPDANLLEFDVGYPCARMGSHLGTHSPDPHRSASVLAITEWKRHRRRKFEYGEALERQAGLGLGAVPHERHLSEGPAGACDAAASRLR